MKAYKNNVIALPISLLSGLLLCAIFPPYDISFLAWIALIPLLTVLAASGYIRAFFIGLLTGIVFWIFHIWWLNTVSSLPFVSFLVIVIYCASFFGLFSLLFSLTVHRSRWHRVLAAPIFWVSTEYLRSNLSFLAIPWSLLGHSQHNNIPLIQISSITSVYGVSFLIVLVNAALSEGALLILNFRSRITIHQITAKSVYSLIAGSIALVLIICIWGNSQIKNQGVENKPMLTASLIQGNIPQDKKWDPAFQKEVIGQYHELTIKVSSEKPDIIIWPETATPGYLKNDPLIYLTVKEILKETDVPLLLGSSSYAKLRGHERKTYRFKNSAFLVDRNGRIADSYDKIRLLPFGEYLPLERRFPWPKWLVPEMGLFVPGMQYRIFELPKGKFGVVICWENLFSGLFRRFVKEGAQFMVNLTNEAWFGETAASQQIMSMAVFRAVENRVSLLRCANTGISGIIDPFGRILAKITDNKGKDIMIAGTLTVTVPKPAGKTFYTQYGDVFAIACSALALFFLISALLPLKIVGKGFTSYGK